MRIAHLSDLHFGTEAPDLLSDFKNHIRDISPDLFIISGDFTQTGSTKEFVLARDFMHGLGAPCFCVPGNHDIPRYDLAHRFFDPLHYYRKYIGENPEPVLRHDDILIAGVNTARAVLPHWNWANGAISSAQLRQVENLFSSAPGSAFRICVMHHPLQRAEGAPLNTVVFGGGKALAALTGLHGADLVLTGHVHHASITEIGKTVFLSASTTLSSRVRSQVNGFNLITFEDGKFSAEIFSYRNRKFYRERIFEFSKTGV